MEGVLLKATEGREGRGGARPLSAATVKATMVWEIRKLPTVPTLPRTSDTQ